MFYVGIFQLFLTFVLYKHKLVAKKSGFLLNWSKIVQQYDRSDVVTQQIQVKNLLTVYLLIIIMFYTDFVCTMNFLHHRGGGVNCILTAPIKVPWCELLGLFLKKIIHLSVLLHMYPQKTWVRAGKVTRDAFVWLFSTVCFQMLTQQPCLRRCKVTLVAFVCFFSTVCYQMCPQSVYPRGGIVTLIAFV